MPNKGNNPKRNSNEINNRVQTFFKVFCAILIVSSIYYYISRPFCENLENTSTLVEKLRNNEIDALTHHPSRGLLYITLNEKGKRVAKEANPKFNTASKGPHYQLPVSGNFKRIYYEHLTKGIKAPVLNNGKRDIFDTLMGSSIWNMIIYLLLLLFLASFFFSDVIEGSLGISSPKATLWNKKNKTGITFRDVKGMEEAKEQLLDIIDYFKHPGKYRSLGAMPPKGILLIGPPGTGKTLLAKAVAGESKVPFLSVGGSDFEEMFVGVGARRVRNLFKEARKNAPCIVFIDEIDGIGYKRRTTAMEGASMEAANTLNQLLSEIDGFKQNEGILLLASTNREKVLDSALTRPGRFGRKVHTTYPTIKERGWTFDYYIRKIKVSNTIDTTELARQTAGFSYADIKEICNDAALITASKKEKYVTMANFSEAIDQRIAGIARKEKILKGKEKNIVAIHEAGHAIVGHCLPNSEPMVKVTIVPRLDSALGFAQYQPNEKLILQKSYLLDEICISLGGKAAEETYFGEGSTGALNDLEHVSKIAHSIVTMYGLDEEMNNLCYYDTSSREQHGFVKPYSDKTALLIDQRVKEIVNNQYKKALTIIKNNKTALDKIATALKERETLSRAEFEDLIGPKSAFVEKMKVLFSKPEKKKPIKNSKNQLKQ